MNSVSESSFPGRNLHEGHIDLIRQFLVQLGWRCTVCSTTPVVEEKYSKLFVENNGRPAIPVRVALGAHIVKEKKKLSDEELVEDIR
jgi:hypothetical protein